MAIQLSKVKTHKVVTSHSDEILFIGWYAQCEAFISQQEPEDIQDEFVIEELTDEEFQRINNC